MADARAAPMVVPSADGWVALWVAAMADMLAVWLAVVLVDRLVVG